MRALVNAWFSQRNRPARLVDVVLALAILLAGWVSLREMLRIQGRGGERGEGNRVVEFSITGSELGQEGWHVGDVVQGKQGAIYEASIVDAEEQLIFKIKLDSSTGEVLAKGQKPTDQAVTPLPAVNVRQTLETVLSDLSLGEARQKGKHPFYEVALTYGGQEVARVRVDPVSREVIPKGQEREASQGKAADDDEDERGKGKKLKVVPKNLVVLLGWVSALTMIVSSLYYSWKRSLYGPIRAASGEAKARAAAGLRSTLRWHMALGVLAVAVAGLHVLNFTSKLQLSVSWLVLAMAVTVALSGVFGQFVAKTGAIRRTWRRFHVPYTLLFFALLLVHVLEKTKAFG